MVTTLVGRTVTVEAIAIGDAQDRDADGNAFAGLAQQDPLDSNP